MLVGALLDAQWIVSPKRSLPGWVGGILNKLVPRLVIPAEILWISVPVALFSQESRFLFPRNFFGTPSGILSVWGLRRMLRKK